MGRLIPYTDGEQLLEGYFALPQIEILLQAF